VGGDRELAIECLYLQLELGHFSRVFREDMVVDEDSSPLDDPVELIEQPISSDRVLDDGPRACLKVLGFDGSESGPDEHADFDQHERHRDDPVNRRLLGSTVLPVSLWLHRYFLPASASLNDDRP
jgi:hypothetical protein